MGLDALLVLTILFQDSSTQGCCLIQIQGKNMLLFFLNMYVCMCVCACTKLNKYLYITFKMLIKIVFKKVL